MDSTSTGRGDSLQVHDRSWTSHPYNHPPPRPPPHHAHELRTPLPIVASSGTLWATASKDWVIPAKPKPGRKYKKDAPLQPQEEPEQRPTCPELVSHQLHFVPSCADLDDRAAQRAFREHNQSQLAKLQARVQQYEQGEIERNMALLNIAKRLKEEDEKLNFCRNYPAQKKPKYSTNPLGIPSHVPPLMTSYLPSLSSAVSSPDSSGSSISMPTPHESSLFSTHLPTLAALLDPPSSSFVFECGCCSSEASCVCCKLAIHPLPDKVTTDPLKLEPADPVDAPLPISILDDLLSYQPPVPLRHRTVASTPVFQSPHP
ncbi:hypothetical protein OE88DRAFT_1740469 [Heliocybe sulcata]|uniref:Hap4 transcription factor heteromerisation domain-containing protein n=1 Tax=Heliocybe sulcata TaxID=5364 RepID=A0A5C3MKK8_9AGAM|nr:hypothetical protein OE88DRAFT_1740469 [Heliocybe sulcata]